MATGVPEQHQSTMEADIGRYHCLCRVYEIAALWLLFAVVIQVGAPFYES